MKFKKEFLQEVVDEDTYEAEKIEENIIDRNRWSIYYEMIFKYKDKFYSTCFSRGATEMQEERPYEYDPDEIECYEVHQIWKTVKVWEIVKDEK